jgi:hypothetical protein
MALLVAACQPEPQEPPRPSPSDSSAPSPSQPFPGDTVHFTAQGDIGVGSGAQKVLDVIADLKPQLNLALGDFTYEAGIDQRPGCRANMGRNGMQTSRRMIPLSVRDGVPRDRLPRRAARLLKGQRAVALDR